MLDAIVTSKAELTDLSITFPGLSSLQLYICAFAVVNLSQAKLDGVVIVL